MIKSEDFLLTFEPSKNLPSPGGRGRRGGGLKFLLSTPTLSLPHRRVRGEGKEISNIFG